MGRSDADKLLTAITLTKEIRWLVRSSLSGSHCEGLAHSLPESPPCMANEKQEMVFYNHYDRFSPFDLVLQFQHTAKRSVLYLQSGFKQNTNAVYCVVCVHVLIFMSQHFSLGNLGMTSMRGLIE